MNYTSEQLRVITTRDKDILVSAAAGSGKTAVLVERIIRRVLDESAPVNIDQLLVMTFTEAAAAEMKERIGNAIEARLKEQPLNSHLQKQSLLIHQAPITTIHGFCLNVIRNHFHEIDLDPGFRVADEGECKLLKADVLERVLESAYEQADEDFLFMVECYGAKKSDTSVEELVMGLYNYAMSYPFPEDWLLSCKKTYELQDVTNIEDLDWITNVIEDLQQTIADVRQQAQAALEMCTEPDGPHAYEQAIASDVEMLDGMAACETYLQYAKALSTVAYEKLGRIKASDGTDSGKQAMVKGIRDRYKKLIDRLREQYFYETPEQMLIDMQGCRCAVSALADLTCEFVRFYAEAKREKNIIDFSDMEHMALQILLHKDGEQIVPSRTAMEYRDYYEEILVDEYQDSNLVQEYLIRSISKESADARNVFMVGDVKQSIYRFRLARPELFMEKYHAYPVLSGDGAARERQDLKAANEVQEEQGEQKERIDLHKNFRSRKNVLDTVNLTFSQIMRKEIGGIDYDDAAALHYGADYPEDECEAAGRTKSTESTTCPVSPTTELLLIQMKPQKLQHGEQKEPDESQRQTASVTDDLPDAKEAEARVIAGRIAELVCSGQVWDKHEKAYRRVRYSDIVILLRTNRNYDEIYSRVLQEAGIPTHIASKTGYFTTTEVETLLQFLRILDNPLQDIPLAAVMKSMFGNFTDEELAIIRASRKKRLLFHATTEFAEQSSMPELQVKTHNFLESIQYYRSKIPYTSVYYLLYEIVNRTGYLSYVSALPRGGQRRANVNMLLTKADDYGKTSYKGLFHFIRYIEYLRKYDVDYGEVNLASENDNTVRIMSIHKSKGLEFPICILAAMNKKINFQDANQAVVTDIDYGIGVNSIDPVRRLRVPTLLKKVMQKKSRIETLSEELRILYVAMTRAEEKLILTAAVDDIEKRLQSSSIALYNIGRSLPITLISSFTSYLDMILYAWIRHKAAAELLERYGLEYVQPQHGNVTDMCADIQIKVLGIEDLVLHEMKEQLSSEEEKKQLLSNANTILQEEQIISERFSYRYPYESSAQIRMKVSVSELKKQHMEETMAEGEELFSTEEVIPCIPLFISKREEVSAVQRGTAYHKLLEMLDYSIGADRQSVSTKELMQHFAQLCKQGHISEEFFAVIRPEDMECFRNSSIAQRMGAAFARQELYREQPFVLGVDAEQVYPGMIPGETVLVQGIIDAYFEEDGELVVVDYKTDRVQTGEELIKRYKTQLDYYAQALEQLTGKHVKEETIYSFALGREINLVKMS